MYKRGIGTILSLQIKIHSMKRLIYPLMLVTLSLFAAAAITTITAKTLASYYKDDAQPAGLAHGNAETLKLTASR